MMKRSNFSQKKSWTLYGQKFGNYDKFKKSFAGSLCGKLQKHLQSLRDIEKDVLPNSAGSDRTLFVKICVDLKMDIHDTLGNQEWKPDNDKSASHRYLNKIVEIVDPLVTELLRDNWENLRTLAESKAKAFINVIPPSAVKGGFCTVKLKKGTSVKVDESHTVKLENTCSVVSLIKLIGKCMSSQKFLSHMDKLSSVSEKAKSSEPGTSEYQEVSSSDSEYSERSHSGSHSSEDSSSDDSSSYSSEYWQSEDTPRPNPENYSRERY